MRARLDLTRPVVRVLPSPQRVEIEGDILDVLEVIFERSTTDRLVDTLHDRRGIDGEGLVADGNDILSASPDEIFDESDRAPHHAIRVHGHLRRVEDRSGQW